MRHDFEPEEPGNRYSGDSKLNAAMHDPTSSSTPLDPPTRPNKNRSQWGWTLLGLIPGLAIAGILGAQLAFNGNNGLETPAPATAEVSPVAPAEPVTEEVTPEECIAFIDSAREGLVLFAIAVDNPADAGSYEDAMDWALASATALDEDEMGCREHAAW